MLYLSTTIPGTKLGLAKLLMEQGYNVIFVSRRLPESIRREDSGKVGLDRNMFRVEFYKHSSDENQDKSLVYAIPRELGYFTFAIVATESREKNSCQIICDEQGRKLRPFRISESEDNQAWFKSRFPLVVVEANSKIKLVKNSLQINERKLIATIERKQIWVGGYDEELPAGLSCFSDAVNAARAKDGCPDCHCVHYYSV